MTIYRILPVIVLGLLPSSICAANLANPAVVIPEARASVGVSYNLGFHTITNRYVPMLMNRFHARGTFAPSSYLNVGIDAGISQLDVAADTTGTDTLGVFHGEYGFSGGGHVKLATPFFFDELMSIVGMATGTYFKVPNENGAWYGGVDGTGSVGFQFRIPRFGYLTAGGQMYLIQGRNQGYTGSEGRYANSNNIRGWFAVDYFPELEVSENASPYISLEISLAPDVDYIREGQPPFREIGFSISIGSVTRQLWGEETERWDPAGEN